MPPVLRLCFTLLPFPSLPTPSHPSLPFPSLPLPLPLPVLAPFDCHLRTANPWSTWKYLSNAEPNDRYHFDFRNPPTLSHLIGKAEGAWRRLDAGGVAIPPWEVFDQSVDHRGSVPIDSRDTLDPARRSLSHPFVSRPDG